MSDFLMHYGVKGMRWGVWNDETRLRYAGGRRHVTTSAKINLKQSKSTNVDKWGKDKNHNVLYITGLSGSGKSTVAEGLRNKDTNIIHLDYYTNAGKNTIGARGFRDKEFNEHLKKHCPEFFKEYDGEMPALSKLTPEQKKKFWSMMDKFQDSMVSFGREQYGKKRVIVEGVKLIDDTFFPDKSFFKDQPLIVLSTDYDTSIKRASERDNVDLNDDKLNSIRKSMQDHWNESLTNLLQTAEVKLGEEYVSELLKSM